MSQKYAGLDAIEKRCDQHGLDIEKIKSRLKKQHIETPSWGYGDSGTRFRVFPWSGAARTAREKLSDAAMVHKLTGVAPSVALHIPWDKVDDWLALKSYASEIGIELGAINPNVFQDEAYKFGSICHTDAKVRRMAVDHMLECVDIMKATGSRDLSNDVHLSGLRAPWRKPRPRSDILRPRKAGRIINGRFDCQGDDRTDTRHRHHQTANIVVFCQTRDFGIQVSQLGAQLGTRAQKSLSRRGQDLILLNQFPHPGLVPNPGDMPQLHAKVSQNTPHRKLKVDDGLLN